MPGRVGDGSTDNGSRCSSDGSSEGQHRVRSALRFPKREMPCLCSLTGLRLPQNQPLQLARPPLPVQLLPAPSNALVPAHKLARPPSIDARPACARAASISRRNGLERERGRALPSACGIAPAGEVLRGDGREREGIGGEGWDGRRGAGSGEGRPGGVEGGDGGGRTRAEAETAEVPEDGAA